MTKMAITVWKDGGYKLWRALDATYAQDDPEWLATIPIEMASSPQPTASFEARVEAALKAMWYHPGAEIGTSFWDKWVKNKPAMAAALRAADAIAPPSPALPAEVAALVERARGVAAKWKLGLYDTNTETAAIIRSLAATAPEAKGEKL